MRLNSKAFKAATAAAISAALVASATPAATAETSSLESLDTAAQQGIYAISGIAGSILSLAISYVFWGTVYNFARSQNWINNVPVAPGLPNFNRP